MLASNVIFVEIYVHLPNNEGSCSFRPSVQLELHRGMTFESKAFLFSNDEAGEKYGDASQQ